MSVVENFLNRTVKVISEEVKENKIYKRKLWSFIAMVIASTAIVSLIFLFCINVICVYLSFNFESELVFDAVFIPSLTALGLYIITQIYFAYKEWKKEFRNVNE
jgi:uncharacterized membrane protein